MSEGKDTSKRNLSANQLKNLKPREPVPNKSYDPGLIKEFLSYQKKSDKSWVYISEILGISTSIISSWKKQRYTGDVEKINEAIRKFLLFEQKKELSDKVELDYVETQNNRRILSVLETAMTDRIMAAIIGDTGTSKTTTAKLYKRDNPNNVIYHHANRTYSRPVDHLRRIHMNPLIGKDGIGTMNRLAYDIISEIRQKNILLIVDQADYLNLSSIDIFRTINEEAEVGVVFMGLPSFLSKIRGNEPEVRQVRDRIKTRLTLKPYKAEEAEKILNYNFPGLNGLAKDFYLLSNGSIRILSGLVYNVKKIIKSKGVKMDETTITKAAALLERRIIE